MSRRHGERQIASILEDLSAEIEALGAALCADPHLSNRHCETLQAIDRVAQNQRWLAQVLRADCRTTAAEQIGVEALRYRLGQN